MAVTAASKRAVSTIRQCIESTLASLGADDYREVVDEIGSDMDGRWEALKEEEGDEDE